MTYLSELWIYPLKSGRGIRLEQSEITPMGLAHDRRWMLVDATGRFLSQRQCPLMAKIEVSLAAHSLDFGFEGHRLTLPLPPYAQPPELEVSVWESHVLAQPISALADSWFSARLERPCRLVYMPDSTFRPTSPDYAPGQQVGFADGFPFLLCNQDSLDDLNARLTAKGEASIGIDRFRPNLVVSGAGAFAEDEWRELRIGELGFRRVKPCERCVIVTTDQRSGVVGKEPLRTLASYRRLNGKVIFGENLICHSKQGQLRVGSPVSLGDAG